ncbi:MAG: hypothetical protein ACE5IR_11850 [bacterium]
MKELFSDGVSSSDSQSSFELPPDQYEQLVFRFAVTTDTGQTLTMADLGEVQITDGKGQQTRIDFASLQDRAFAVGGILQDVSGSAATAENVAVPIPFALPGDEDAIFEVGVAESVTVRLFYASTLATRIGSNTMTVTVNGVVKDGIQYYRLLHNRFDIPITSGLTTKTLPFENIQEIWMERTSNISRVVINSEGNQPYNAALNDLIQFTHARYNLETFSSTPNKLALPLNLTSEVDDGLHDNVQVQIDGSGTDTITLHVVSVDFTPDEMASTQQKKAELAQRKFIAKRNDGKTRPLRAIAQAGS